jgi:hypothetical protein
LEVAIAHNSAIYFFYLGGRYFIVGKKFEGVYARCFVKVDIGEQKLFLLGMVAILVSVEYIEGYAVM